MTLPLVSEGKVFGVIGAGSLSVRRYSKTETDAMALLATQAGAAIINARLFEQLREANKVTVRLPITTGEAAHEEEDDSSESVIDEREIQIPGLRVLIIEDSLDTLNMLKLWLGTFGCEVLMAAEAMEGVRLATEQRPDLIISDIGMPDVDGYEVMRMLRKTPGLEQVPAIALTGYAREEDRELALAAGYNAHISKPANMGRLLYLIKKLTNK